MYRKRTTKLLTLPVVLICLLLSRDCTAGDSPWPMFLSAILSGDMIDCNGDENGKAYLDSCGTCVGGNTGKTPCVFITKVPMNDTGHTWGGDYPVGNNSDCTGVEIGAQDCSHGRDVTHNDDSDGHAGFSFTKLDSNGVALADQSANYVPTPWACVKDNVTGLIWEVKTNDDGLHERSDWFNWYNTDPTTNGGADGYADDNGDICFGYNNEDSATFCNTQAYVNRVNAAGWCGASDWRMPTVEELQGIVSYGRSSSPAIDTDFFPNTLRYMYWSSSPSADDSNNYAFMVYPAFGGVGTGSRDNIAMVRLVRNGQ